MSDIYDLAILGGGPAGITAAIYASRARLNTIWIDKNFAPGGQVTATYAVDNYPGMPGISGMDLGDAFGEHARKLGLEPQREKILSLENISGEIKTIRTKKHEYQAKTLILAFGAEHRKLDIPGEDDLGGLGVSYCATCDGAFFRGRTVAVVGGGDVALEDAIYLARTCEKVYLIHRRDSLRGAMVLQEELKSLPNVEILYDHVVTEICGEDMVEKLRIKNVKTEAEKDLEAAGIFIAVGIHPNTELLRELVAVGEDGYIPADETGETGRPGIYVAGDIRKKPLRQVVTAVADGANAAVSAGNYCNRFR